MRECACSVGMRAQRIELIRGLRLLGGAPNKMSGSLVLCSIKVGTGILVFSLFFKQVALQFCNILSKLPPPPQKSQTTQNTTPLLSGKTTLPVFIEFY